MLFAAAGSLENRALVGALSVLPGDSGGRMEGVLAEVGVVFQEALAGAVEVEAEAGDGGIGNGLKGGADAGDLFAIGKLFVDGGGAGVGGGVGLAFGGE